MFPLIILFLSGLLVYVSKYKHFLTMLLSLEVVVLSVFVLMFLFCNVFNLENFLSVIYLSFSVCEGALGLGLLVLIIRTHGSDMVMIFDLLW
uniref:NADH-ubiquinone oxidoreductase chain 4L n=2 Tax=Curculionoidea TaxID=71529 RepID=A0A343A637_9CUCU|nr:NADH dehydrogenase subunit 4L [Scolytinae sp. BMNH 1040265]AOY40276.1 NADH dehydrogenase subunit 4L [Curculionoidea sp. 2 KM-2015]